MVHVFCNQRGSGKTKALINLANDKVAEGKGHVVFINDDNRPMLQLNKNVRFISTEGFNLEKLQGFYGFLCGIISEDYDIDTILIDGLFNIIEEDLQNAAQLFYLIEKLSEKNNVSFYININGDSEMPEFIKKYVA
ncbi:DUF960 domain-containing protein [Clostridium thailandense]|uniref:Twitching motility protein PilT n=1 Tax=Clostridium thailandense TaxID=2794346 RepID=A0A949TUL7_9CLOT|nr:DUF960 domain-containing protein [Clostridium thailandense]MBV7271705.1 hypothetical protein [Clostridium thailandense]MCH5136324.1 hypothetical protein [Clostridiaceae bacterium UIB06]